MLTTPEILKAFKTNGDWAAYEGEFLPLLASRDTDGIGRELMARAQSPCLLCAEPEADYCHRRLVAEWWAEHLPDVEVIHL